MNIDSWTDHAPLGLVPHFHADPVLGGPPLVSTDGHWWWDGTHWAPLHPDAHLDQAG